MESRYTARAMRAFLALLGRPTRGNSRVIGIPVFMDAKNLQVFIDEDLRHGSKKRKPARGGRS